MQNNNTSSYSKLLYFVGIILLLVFFVFNGIFFFGNFETRANRSVEVEPLEELPTMANFDQPVVPTRDLIAPPSAPEETQPGHTPTPEPTKLEPVEPILSTSIPTDTPPTASLNSSSPLSVATINSVINDCGAVFDSSQHLPKSTLTFGNYDPQRYDADYMENQFDACFEAELERYSHP